MNIKYTLSGFIYITPDDDCRKIVDVMLETDYNEEFCISDEFSPEFVARLMEAGFLVMSMNVAPDNEESSGEPFHILLPKLHLVRSALFFENLHIKKSMRRFIKNKGALYELKADADFDYIIDRCVEKHGCDWLTPPLVDCIKRIRRGEGVEKRLREKISDSLSPTPCPYPASFALYREGRLVAGEFGVICGRVYTSYSGFFEEDNTGTLQIILTTRYLRENGFSFFDLGMPLDYKNDLGAVDISPEEFVRLFRA